MLKLTRTGIGLLTRQYRSVLHKCWLINVGLWQTMGDAVSKAVSVPARLVASLLSGGALSGEAFNVLDEILLSRLFERKLASLTAIGLTIAALALPSEAEASAVTDILDLLNTGKETWTISGSSEQPVSFNETTKKATGTIGVPIDNAITYYTYTYTMPSNYTSQSPITTLTADNAVNKYFYNISQTVSSGTSYIFAYPVDIHSQVSSYGIKSDFIKNSTIATNGIHADGSAVAIRQSTIKGIEGNFIGNTASSDYLTQGGAIHFVDAKMDYLRGDFINNIGYGGQAIGGAFSFHYLSKIDSIEGLYVRNGVIGTSAIGGAFATDIGSDVTPMIQSISANFIGNYAEATTSYARGGAIYNTGTITNIGTATNKVTFSGNYAQSTDGEALGGAIYNAGTINNIYADFTSNYATSVNGMVRGGAIYNEGTIGNITGIFDGNKGIGDKYDDRHTAGTIANYGKMTITNSTFQNNAMKGAQARAGVFNNQANLIIKNSTFTNNSSDQYGGVGVNGANLLITNSTFTGNSAVYGATIDNYQSSNLIIKNSSFSGNTAAAGQGTLHFSNGSITLIDSQVQGNSAYGIATVTTSPIAKIIADSVNITFKNNVSSNKYADIYNLSNIYLNAKTNKNISFGGTISGSGTLNINQSGLIYKDMNDDYTLTENSITQTGGNYIFNNAISGGNVNLYNNANVKFGSLLQNDNTTSYGSFALNALANDANGGHIDMRNSHIDSNSATTLTLDSQLKIGIDLQHPTSGTTGTADNITYTTGSGSILIDAINELGTRPTATGTYLYQVLNGSGVTLALTDAIKTEWNTDTTTSSPKVRDPIPATTAWTDKIYNRWTDTRVQGSLDVSGNNLVYSVINTQTAQSEVAGDTLALVTTATNNASRIFSTTDATAEYLLSTNLGAVNAVYKNLSINGTVSGDNRSTLNLGNYNGFVLDSSDDNLSLSSMKVSGGTDYSVNLADSGSKLDVADVVMDNTAAPITGAGNVEFTGTNEINTKVLNTGTTTVSSGTTDFNDKVAGFTVSAPATVSIAADDITAETTNNGTLELEGGNVTTKLMGTGRMKLMSGNVRLLSSTPPATTGSLSFGSSSDYADSILTSSSAASTSDHALVTAGYLDNNYYMNYGDSMAKSFIKAANDNNFTTLNCVKEA